MSNIELVKMLVGCFFKLIAWILNISQAKTEQFRTRIEQLQDPSCGPVSVYIRTILKHYVKRDVNYYNDVRNKTKKGKPTRSLHIVRQLIDPLGIKNIFILGTAGSGKSTLLKKLYAYTSIRNYNYLYFNAHMSMFEKCSGIEDLLKTLSNKINESKKKTVVFIDGFDEFQCLSGSNEELNKLFNFIIKHNRKKKNGPHKFVVSTRPEHFLVYSALVCKKRSYNLDHFCFYEMKQLTRRESFRISKNVKYLYLVDQANNNHHFNNKWPEKDKEKEYIKNLKKYLQFPDFKNPKKFFQNTGSSDSLLSSPIMCRYAYPIVCDWVIGELNTQGELNAEDRVLYVLESLIKWEYHDTYKKSTGDGNDRDYQDYEKKVLNFLVSVAGKMGDNNTIDVVDWNILRREAGLSNNAALCILQEVKYKDNNENNNLPVRKYIKINDDDFIRSELSVLQDYSSTVGESKGPQYEFEHQVFYEYFRTIYKEQVTLNNE